MIRETRRSERTEALYTELQPQLERILGSNLGAPPWLIEEACQIAWGLLLQGPAPAGRELGWLSTTATRAALRLLRRERLAGPYQEPEEPVSLEDRRAPEPEPEHAFELRERLAEIRRLPVRQQRVVMLHGFGYEYAEIAAVTGETRRSVARQLTCARRRLVLLAQEQ